MLSEASTSASPRMSRVRVCRVSPAAKLTVPFSAAASTRSAPSRLEPASTLQLTVAAWLLALLAAAFLAQVIPTEGVGAVLGPDTGMSGILLASVIGGVMPGGPMTSFPIALIVWQSGAGTAQTVAFLAGWSVFALHRVLAYEAPLMGWRFSGLRLASCFFLPPLAGVLAAAGLWAARSLGLSFAP